MKREMRHIEKEGYRETMREREREGYRGSL
jgi:hypothetical protein